MSTNTPATAPVKKTVKASSNRNDAGYSSDKNTRPISLLTQEELIREGYRYPYVQKPDFKKTQYEREKLKEVHTNKKGPAVGMPKRRVTQGFTLIVHVANTDKNPDFKSTYTFKDVQVQDAAAVMNTMLKGMVITKYHHAGQTYPKV